MHRRIPITNSLSSPSHLVHLSAGHRRLELRCLPVGAEQLSNARGSGSQRETRATVHGIQLLLSSLVLSAALSFETNIHAQSMKETTDWEAILQMPGPFGCLAFSGPLNWHFDWVDAGQKVIPVATGNTSDRLGRKKWCITVRGHLVI